MSFSIAGAFPILAEAVPEFPPAREDWEDQLSYVYINNLARYVCERASVDFEPLHKQFALLLERLYTEGDDSVYDLAHEALETVWGHREEGAFIAQYFGPKTRDVCLRICAGERDG